MKTYVAMVSHDYSGEKHLKAGSKEDCVRYVQEFFDGYGFKMINGIPWDPGNSANLTVVQAALNPKDSGFTCFVDVETDIVDGKVMIAGFMHCDGDGPCASIRLSD